MADYTSDVKMAEEYTDGGPYVHEFIIKEEEEETELGNEEEIRCEGCIEILYQLYLKFYNIYNSFFNNCFTFIYCL